MSQVLPSSTDHSRAAPKLGTAASRLDGRRQANASKSSIWRKLAIAFIVVGALWLAWGLTKWVSSVSLGRHIAERKVYRRIEEEILEWTEHEERVHQSRPHLRKVQR